MIPDVVNFNPLNLDTWLPYSQRFDIPKTLQGIYFVHDLWEPVFYIGQSTNIRARILSHSRKPIFDEIDNRKFCDGLMVSWLEVGNKTLLEPLEHLLIYYLKPQINLRCRYTQVHRPNWGQRDYFLIVSEVKDLFDTQARPKPRIVNTDYMTDED